MSLDQVRAVADAVLYEGYLLYPYRATSRKNQVRWQFGVLGPPGAADEGVGEEPGMATQCLLVNELPTEPGRAPTSVTLRVHLRFLQLQTRTVERYAGPDAGFVPVDELVVGGDRRLSWDEAVEQEVELDYSAEELRIGPSKAVDVDGFEGLEQLTEATGDPSASRVVGRIVRRRWPLRAEVTASTTDDEGGTRLEVRVDNVTPEEPPRHGTSPKDRAIRRSLIGAHLILEAEGGARFVSIIDPPRPAAAAARRCHQHRCWPVLAGERPAPEAGEAAGAADGAGSATVGATGEAGTSAVVLASPIILYDFPEVAAQSPGDLFDSTEIDEILTLRVMTMTEEEKAEARATDPRARQIIDRCDQLSPASLEQLHGILRNPHAGPATQHLSTQHPSTQPPSAQGPGPSTADDIRNAEPPEFGDPDVPWWDPAADGAVHPELDAVVVDGISVSKGSLVRVHPSRRADAQDLFFAGQVARVTAVLSDVDGGVHVALVLADDPAADLHDWYGRYWYFAPDELEPLTDREAEEAPIEQREERGS